MTDSVEDLKRQLRQLQELVDSGVLSAEGARQGRDELERRLVAAVMAEPGPTAGARAAPPAAPARAAGDATGHAATHTEPPAPRPSRKLVLGLAAGVLLFAGAGYAWRGNFDGWSAGPGETPTAAATGATGPTAAHATSPGQIEAMVASLAERLKQQPDDAEGWLMLGRSYAVLGRHAEAIPAYRKALALNPQDAQALADLADALAVGQQGRFDGEPTQLIQAAVKADPKNVKAQALAGTLAFERQDYAAAAQHWEQAVTHGAPDSPLVAQMRASLAEARQRAGLPPLPDAPAAPGGSGGSGGSGITTAPEPAASTAAGMQAVAPAQVRISGRVELAAALAAKAQPEDVVFIFARPAQGARMPLAILKKRVRDLPLDFSLDDSLAMSPAAKLSGAASVVVGARVSRSGQAMPQPGDLQGQSATPVTLGSSGVRIVISEEVR